MVLVMNQIYAGFYFEHYHHFYLNDTYVVASLLKLKLQMTGNYSGYVYLTILWHGNICHYKLIYGKFIAVIYMNILTFKLFFLCHM